MRCFSDVFQPYQLGWGHSLRLAIDCGIQNRTVQDKTDGDLVGLSLGVERSQTSDPCLCQSCANMGRDEWILASHSKRQMLIILDSRELSGSRGSMILPFGQRQLIRFTHRGDNWPTVGNMMDTLSIARREEEGQSIVEYALILAVILVVVAGSAWLIVHAIIGR